MTAVAQRFFAFVTILSVTFTQACPAFALRPEGVGSPSTKAGLEEALGKGGNSAVLPPPSSALAFQVVTPVTSRGIDSALLAEIFRHLNALPENRRNAREMMLEALSMLRQMAAPELAVRIPVADAIAAQLDDLIQKSPALGCPTCGAKVAHAILSDPFSNPEYTQSEELQTPEFQASELLNAVLLALSTAQNGRLITVRSQDGHLMPASTVADLRDLLALAEAHPGYPAEAAHDWAGVRMTQQQIKEALGQGQVVVAHVGGNHFVQVIEITAGKVFYTDPQLSAFDRKPISSVSSQSEQGFFQWWKGNARSTTDGVTLIGFRSGQPLETGERMSDAEMASVTGCCGINAMFGHFRGVRKILDAVLRLKYRAPDDTGILVVTRKGLVVRKVQGAPDALILEMIEKSAQSDGPLFPETLELPVDLDRNRKAVTAGKAKRREILRAEGLLSFVTPDWQDPGAFLNDLTESDIDGLYQGVYTVGIGDVGSLFAGWVYTLGSSADHYQALNGPSLQLKNLLDRWDVAPEFIKLFIRHRFLQELSPDPTDAERVKTLADFDRLGDRALKQDLDPKEEAEWDRIWKQYLEGKKITIPPDFNRDPVRHVARLLDQLVGSFGEHPEWESQVQEKFGSRRPIGASRWQWRARWKEEMQYNLPGHAWGALVDWVQDWALSQGLVTEKTHREWAKRRQEQIQRRGFSEGTVDLSLLLLIPEIVLGHGRWAMTGDPSAWNGHPQTTTVRAIVHNGAIEASKNAELSAYDPDKPWEEQGEHVRLWLDEMERALRLRQTGTRDEDFEEAVRIEQAALKNYGPIEMVGETAQTIRTDTRTITRHWHLLADDFKADKVAGRVKKDGTLDLTQTPPKPGTHLLHAADRSLIRPGAVFDKRPVFDRARAWNQVVQNLREKWGETEPNYDEVAHRVAMMELAPGSGIATDGVSLATPLTEFVTSHDRPVDIVIYQKKDAAGNVLYEDYMVTSDQAAGIGLFPAPEVNAAAKVIARLGDEMMATIDDLREELADHRILEDSFKAKVEAALTRWVEGKDRIINGERIVEEGPDGTKRVRYRGGFHVQVYHLKGKEKYARIRRKLDENGRQKTEVQISRFNGDRLNPDDKDEAKIFKREDTVVNPTLGDHGRFPSFMAYHVYEIPRILLEQILRYTGAEPSGRLVTTMGTVFPEGQLEPVIEQDEAGLGTRYHPDTKVARPGINAPILLKHFGADLEEAVQRVNRIPGLKRIVLAGVGSSYRDAKVVQATFQELLPSVEILFYDPVDISNRGIELDPKTDLLIGMSWSGSTDSMVKLFDWLDSEGFVTIGITGKPDNELGRDTRLSGGTLDVLSGDEQSVATTKGFEAVLYSLSLLAVDLSQLQGDPDLEEVRQEYLRDLRKVTDEVYEILSEGKKPEGTRVLDLEDQNSTVNRLGRKYQERHKMLWIGSRDMPIHEEGELKVEEIVSSKEGKPSMMGIALDIEDSSWQSVVTHNYDPKAKEEDKVILGFDMTDPDKFDLFMDAIREQANAGGDMIILTHDGNSNPHYDELVRLAEQSDGRIELVTLPRLRLTLQPLVNAIFYFRFSLAAAMQRKMTQQEIDNSRNLAKSVTVSYAQRLRDLILTTRTKVVTIAQHAVGWVQKASVAVAKHLRSMTGRGAWDSVRDTRLRAIQRLPFVLQRAYDRFFGEGSWLQKPEERQRLEQTFGQRMEGIRQIVIITDEPAMEYAALASEDPMGSVEKVYSGESATKEGLIYTGTYMPIQGYYYRVTFDRDADTYALVYEPEYPQNQGLALPENRDPIIVTHGMKEITVNGKGYAVASSSFMKDKKKPRNLAFGLSLRATNPDLFGAPVKVYQAGQRSLDRELGRGDTLFILASRSNNFHQQNREIPPVSGAINQERSLAELAMSDLARRPETAMMRRAEQLQERGGRFITLSDAASALCSLGERALGNVGLPSDLDDISLYSVTYMGLLSIGVKLGALKGIETGNYQKAIGTVPGLVAALLRDSEVDGRVKEFVKRYGNYKKLQIVGGGQAHADAKEYARVMRTLGIFAEAQLNDSMWHGPLAVYDPSREKYANQDRRTGINPNFNPRNDALTLVLMTDRRFFDTALGGDAQVLDSRNARFALVVKSSDAGNKAVQDVGADRFGIFPLGDFPDELGSFVNAAAAQYFALRFAEAHQKTLGRPILPPAGGRVPVEVVPSGFLPELRADLVQHVGQVGLRNAFGLVEAVRQDGNPRVSVFPDQTGLDRRSVILVAAADRLGLIGDIGTAVAEVGISIERQHTDNDPPTPVSGQQRIGVFMLTVEEPVSVVRGKQVEAAILRVLEAQPPMDFDAAVTAMLEVEKLPVTEVIADGVRAAHEAYLSTGGEPQVEVFSHPSRDSNKAVLVAVSRDRVGMLKDVIGPVSDEEGMGANLQMTGAQTIGDVAFVILNIGDIGPKGFPAFEAVKNKIRGLLSTPTVPDSFRERLRPFEAQMGGISVRSIYAAYKNLQDLQTPNYVIRSRYVPDRATQSALTLIVRDEERFNRLDAGVRKIIQRNRLRIVPADGAEMAFNVDYQEGPGQQGVRILRYVVNAPRDDPRVVEARDSMEELVGGDTAPSEIPLSSAARAQIEFRGWLVRQNRNEAEIEWLEDLYRQYHGVPRIAVEVVPSSEGGETAVVGLAPYAPPVSMSESDFARAVKARIQQLASAAGISPVQNAAPLTTFLREFDLPHPMVVVQLTFQMSRERLADLGVIEAVDDVLVQLSRSSEVSRGGLEEASPSPLALSLPDRWPSFDQVVGQLRQSLAGSSFLRTVRDHLRLSEGVLSGYRPIDEAEMTALQAGGVSAENWNAVYVPVDGLTRGDARRMRDVRLLGTVYLGHLKGNVRLSNGAEVPAEITNSVLRDVVIGNNVLIRDNVLVQRYVIGDGAVVTSNRSLVAEQGTTFGVGKPIPIGPETGGREIKAYPEILLADVVRLARSPGDQAGQAAYAAALAEYLDAAKADYGYIGRGAEVSGVPDGKNLFVDDGGVVLDNTNVHNLLLLTAKDERSVVVGTSEVVNLIAQPGVEINGANVVMGVDDGAHGVLMLEHSHAGNGATIKDSVIAPNTGVEKGEVTSSLLGPFIGMHHDSLVIGVDWGEGMGNVGAGTRLGSNHTGRAPDQELRAGEGVFLGLGSLYSFSGNYTGSPYTIFGKGVSMLPSHVSMPFSLVQKPTVQIPGESPEFMEMSPGWIWSDNSYMVLRNEGKYAGRDKSSRNGLKGSGEKDSLLRRSPFEILRPDTVNQMIQARDILRQVDPATAKTAALPDRVIHYYTDAQIPELGKTFMTESSRVKADNSYTEIIRYYAAKGLWAEVKKLADAGRLSEASSLLTTPSDDLRWEHERRVLLAEFAGKSVPDILRAFIDAQQKLAEQVRLAKEKDDKRGERILDDYGETHTAAANDKFVKQSAKAAVDLRTEVEALLPQLSGLEEKPVTTITEGVLPESDTSMADGVKVIAGSFDPRGLAMGAALSRVTRNGRMAVQVAFVVENDAEADLIRRESSPASTIFSASEYGGSYETALSMARQFLQEAAELGADRPVPDSIQLILHNLFGIELAPESVPVWNAFIERVRATLARQA